MGWRGLGQARLKRGGRRVDIVLGARGPNGEAWDAVGPRAWVVWTDKAGREEKQLGRQNFILLRNTSPPRLQRKDAISTSEPSLSDPDRDESKLKFTVLGGASRCKTASDES